MPPALKASCIHLVSEKTRTSLRKSTTCPPACGQVNGVRERNEYKVQHMRERHSRCNTHARHSRCNTHARAGLREWSGPKSTRRARATRPATSQHRVGRRRRGSDERRRTLLFARELLDAFQQRELRCRYFLPVRSLGVSLGVALEPPNRARQTPPTQRSTPVCSANPSRKKICPLWATPNRE